MKFFIKALALMLFVVPSFAQTTAEKITVVVNAGKFTVDKANVSAGWRHDAVSVVLGINDRRRAGFNTTHTYDDFGLVLFEKSDNNVGTGVLSEVQFYLGAVDTNAVTPKGLFKGKIQIEKLKISNKLSWKKVKETLKDYSQSESYMAHNYRLAYKGLYIYFQFDEAETSLLKISIGKDNGGS